MITRSNDHYDYIIILSDILAYLNRTGKQSSIFGISMSVNKCEMRFSFKCEIRNVLISGAMFQVKSRFCKVNDKFYTIQQIFGRKYLSITVETLKLYKKCKLLTK